MNEPRLRIGLVGNKGADIAGCSVQYGRSGVAPEYQPALHLLPHAVSSPDINMSYKPTSFPGFDAAFDAKTVPASFGFSSAVVIPAGASIISTAGHVGTLDKDLKIQGDLKQQMMDSWKVRLSSWASQLCG